VPKRIVKTVRQLELEALIVDRVLGPTVPEGARVHATVVHQHLYGLTFRLCWPLATRRVFFGTTHHFLEPLLSSLKAGSVLVTSPSHLSRLGGLSPLPAERHPSVVVSGGAPLPDSAVRATRDVLGCATREFFGSTEAGVIATRLRQGDEQPSWRPMPGLSVTRLDDGRLHVCSPYLGDPDNAVTGDLIELDGDGGFRLMGRADRIAKIEGLRISLDAFDARLAELEGVSQAAVVVLGAGTHYLGAVVVLDAIGKTERARRGVFRLGRRLRRDLSRTLPSAALPRRWRFVLEMPTGPLGKASAADLAVLFDVPQLRAAETNRTATGPRKIEPQLLACRQMVDGVELDLRIEADLAPLTGHFPGLPIVPGVCLLDWVVRFSGNHLALLQDGATQVQIKFRNVLQPDRDVTLRLRRLSGQRVQFDYRHLETVYASGTVSMGGA
jgi:acyl-coenzyme A synthetase/AMP-(fatty) acid ligase